MTDETTQDVEQPTNATTPAAVPTFTQDELNRHAGRARSEGRQAVLNDLGVANIDELKAVIAEGKKAAEARKTELERVMEQADAHKLTISKLETTVTELHKRIAALRAGLNEKLWPSVMGEDLEAMTESAKELVAELVPTPPATEAEPPAKTPPPDTNATGGRAKVRRGPSQFTDEEIAKYKKELRIP